ncbi:MAG: hypothetical protein K2J31_05125 [Alistipes sp.]|nr:hypothetical protein [Alistipes sp.]
MAEKQIVSRLTAQVERLIEDHRRISADCRALVAERDGLAAENRALQQRLRELDARVKSIELGQGLSGNSGDRERARLRVNSLLREVDKCIAMLDKAE